MVTIPLNLTGGTYKHKSLPLSAQITRNFWPMKQSDEKALSKSILSSFPGLKYKGTASGADRGLFEQNGVLYKVTGQTLYSVVENGTHTSLATIPGADRCVFAALGDFVIIVTGGVVYTWDGVSLLTGTGTDFETPNSVCSLNSQAIYDGDGARFSVSNVSEPLTINGLNYGTAESSPDDILRVYEMSQIILLFGLKTIEPWWNTGDGNPPFDRVETGIVQTGLGALHSTANNDTVLYFYGNDDQVYVLQGYNAAAISPETLAREFAGYVTASDAIGWCMTLQGKNFYVLTFPTANKTWCYQEGGEWFELSSGNEGGRWIANSYAYCYRKHWITDYRNGNLYELDDLTYTENGDTIIRTRDTAPLHAGLLKPEWTGKRLEMNRLELMVETGIGSTTEPEIVVQFSDDGGRTWSTQLTGTLGVAGEYMWKVEWFALGSFDTRLIRLQASGAFPYQIYSAVADVEIGI